MLQLLKKLALIPILLTSASVAASESKSTSCPDYLNLEMRKLHSTKTQKLCDLYKAGKPLVIVNTASHCGYTPQFKDLEALHQKYKDEGLVVIGFPSNSFKQEEKTEEGTARVCYKNYGVTFPMFEHVVVKGSDAHPLFQYLSSKSEAPNWNFNKYLIMGDKVEHFGSKVKPLGDKLEEKLIF